MWAYSKTVAENGGSPSVFFLLEWANIIYCQLKEIKDTWWCLGSEGKLELGDLVE